MLDRVSAIMLILFAVAGAFGVLLVAFSMDIRKNQKVAIAIVFELIYICYVLFFGFAYLSLNYDSMVLYFAVVILALAGLGYLIYLCIKNRRTVKWSMMAVFVLYLALVAYATIFIRRGSYTEAVNMIPFSEIKKVMETGQIEDMEHFLLNVLMFVPMGFLIPLINRKIFDKATFAFLFGFVSTTLIESIQLVFHLGHCDVDDLIANTIGALIGFWIWRLLKGKQTNSSNQNSQ